MRNLHAHIAGRKAREGTAVEQSKRNLGMNFPHLKVTCRGRKPVRTAVKLDEQERLALEHFLKLLKEEQFSHHPVVERQCLARRFEGQILVRVTVKGTRPDLHMAMLTAHKAEQIYKQTGCRFLLLQKPDSYPDRRPFMWADGARRTAS